MPLERARGATGNIKIVFLPDSTSTVGAGKTALTNASGGLNISVRRELSSTVTTYTGANINSIGTLGTWAAPGSGKVNFGKIDDTNQPGMYELQFENSLFGTSDGSRFISGMVSATGVVPTPFEIELTALDNQDAVRAGLTALPNVASGSAGAIPTTGTGANQVHVDGSGNVFAGDKTGAALATSALIGTPNGASVSVDIAEIASETDNIALIKSKTDLLSFTVSGIVDANIQYQNNVPVFNYDFIVASATSSTVTVPASDAGGNSIPDNGQFLFNELFVVGGTGVNQTVKLTTTTGTARQYNVDTTSMPVALDSTSQVIVLGAYVSQATIATTAFQDLLSSSDFSTAGSIGNLLKSNIDFQLSVIASSVQNAAITSSGSAPGVYATSATYTTGTSTGGVANTKAVDGSYDSVADSGGVIDFYYEFPVVAGQLAASAEWIGYVVGTLNTVKFFVRDFTNSAWTQIASLVGITGTANVTLDLSGLTVDHTDATNHIARVRINGTGLTSCTVKTDRIVLTNLYVPPANWNSQLITSDGYSAIDWGHVKAPTTTVDLSNTTIKGIDGVTYPTNFSALAITGGGAVTVGTNNDKAGYSLSVTPPTTGQITAAVFQDLTSTADFTTVGSIGKLLVDNVDAKISTRSTYAGGAVASVTGAVGSVTAAVTVGTNNDKTGYALTSGEETAISTALLKLDLSTITGESRKSLLNALRKIINHWTVAAGTLTVYKEDGTTPAYTESVTNAAGNPVTGSGG